MGYVGLEARAPEPDCEGCGITLNDAVSHCEACAPVCCDWCGETHPASKSSQEFGGSHCAQCVASFLDEDGGEA